MAHPRAHARDMARQTVPASCPRTARRRPAPGTPHRWELGESFCHPSRSTRRTSAPRNTAARSRKDKASRVRRASRVQGAGPTRRRGTYVGEAEGEGWDGMRTGKWDGATRPLSAGLPARMEYDARCARFAAIQWPGGREAAAGMGVVVELTLADVCDGWNSVPDARRYHNMLRCL